MAQGLQHIPLGRSIPQQWDAAWFAKFIREVLALADVRNAIEGPGISISGQPGDVATISASADIQNLLLQSYVTASASVFLPNERVLDGENGVISITDNGPGSLITVGIFDGGIPYSKLNEIDELSVLGNPTPDFGPLTPINGSAEHEVLSVQLNGSDLEVRFGTITHQSVSDFDEAAQDAVGGILTDTATINFTYTDATPAITADAITQMSITADASGIKLVNDSLAPGNNKVYGTDAAGNKGWKADPSGGGGSSSLAIGTVTALSGATLNLSTEGTYDWFVLSGSNQWTDLLPRKRNGISARKFIGFTGGAASSGALTGWGFASAPSYSAVDNAFAAGAGSIANGSFRSCAVNDSCFITLDAGPSVARTVYIYVSNATPYGIYARLSDGTTATATGVVVSNARIPITYTPGVAGLTLLIELRKESSTGNIGISAVTVA